MKSGLVLVALVSLLAVPAQAKRLRDFPNYDYQVLFTNPLCEEVKYEKPVKAANGDLLVAKPKNAYCRRSDEAASAARPSSPQHKLLEWINDPETKEIFFAYLSFSNGTVGGAICNAVKERGVKVTFVLDRGTDDREADPVVPPEARKLMDCKHSSGEEPRAEFRGRVSGIGLAHNKIMIFNPRSEDKVRFVFSSGNLSSGVVLHHENWHFVQTDRSSHFAGAQLCMMDGMLDHAATGQEYRKFIADCRKKIGKPEEEDIRSFFVPGEGKMASDILFENIRKARDIKLAAHRFSFPEMMKELGDRLNRRDSARIRLVADDDLFWAGKGVEGRPNTRLEFFRFLTPLVNDGLEVRYIETNSKFGLLHHNKYAVFDDEAVFAGAGNFTKEAFNKNLENFYFITIPEIVKAMSDQHRHMFESLATPNALMPSENVEP